MKKKFFDILELILIALIYIIGIFTKEFDYCYLALAIYIITILNEISSEIKKKGNK